MKMNTVEEAISELQAGRLIIVVDDPDRENEGDLICAAQFATTYNVNFMATRAKGLICMPMSAEWCDRLDLPQMVDRNTDNHETAFTVSIDHVATTTAVPAICSRSARSQAACSSETAIPKRRSICCAMLA